MAADQDGNTYLGMLGTEQRLIQYKFSTILLSGQPRSWHLSAYVRRLDVIHDDHDLNHFLGFIPTDLLDSRSPEEYYVHKWSLLVSLYVFCSHLRYPAR